MFEFCAQESCTIDANGRLKLSASLQRDFQRHTEGDVVLYCVPEGCLGVFPPDTWQRIRQQDLDPVSRFSSDVVYRRTLRRFGAMSQPTTISAQGRITLPSAFRAYAGLEAGESAILIGCEIGVEIWQPTRWQDELDVIANHVNQKGRQAMQADLHPPPSEDSPR